jgi:hypothetical protein
MVRYFDFHIHGDNIVECERTLTLITTALSDKIISITGPNGSPVCPSFQLQLKHTKKNLQLTFYPGFRRWNEDILKIIRERGGTLREAADVIITGISLNSEEPLIAIEYCGALPAGNQAWQRNGRAYSFGSARIPYLYVAELGGYELDKNRKRKAPRMPNPAVPFSYLTYSIEQDTIVLPVFVTSPGANEVSKKYHADEFAGDELIALTRAIFLDEDPVDSIEILRKKVLSLVKKRAALSSSGQTLTPQQWQEAYNAIQKGRSLVQYLINNVPLPWSKTAYINSLTNTVKKFMDISKNCAIGLTSASLPMCIVPSDNRDSFASQVSALYKNLPANFIKWLTRKEHLVICWVMGFKPLGDDARPDRGLPALTRMLIGHEHDLLTVVYGPAPKATWAILKKDPVILSKQNGLWEAIFAASDALLIDSATDRVTSHGFLRPYWETASQKNNKSSIFVQPRPTQCGENDVDTVLHILLACHAGTDFFEGMCNPPGGDWSGVSLQSPNRSLELRWLSLPRVSGKDTKRPDHVLQIFGISPLPVILSVESKENSAAIEERIGPRLSAYISNLIASPASIERDKRSTLWHHSTTILNPTNFHFASAVAFIPDKKFHIKSIITKTNADLILEFTFEPSGKSCEILFTPTSKIGSLIATHISKINLVGTGISIRVG